MRGRRPLHVHTGAWILGLAAIALLLNVGGDAVFTKGSTVRETTGFVSVLLVIPIAALVIAALAGFARRRFANPRSH